MTTDPRAPGATLGVEEEFHILDPATGRLAPGAQHILDATQHLATGRPDERDEGGEHERGGGTRTRGGGPRTRGGGPEADPTGSADRPGHAGTQTREESGTQTREESGPRTRDDSGTRTRGGGGEHERDGGTETRDASGARTRGEGGADVAVKELHRSMIEMATPVCTDLAGLQAALVAERRSLTAAADRVGLWVAAAGTVPDSGTGRATVYPDDRYRRISDEYRQLATEQQVCACQVQIGVPDPDLAVRLVQRIRGWLPTLLALTAGSPFFQHVDTGYDSYRAIVVARWPTAGPPPVFTDHAGYRQAVERLIHAGVIDDPGMIYYDVRPSMRYPTLEFRIADACPRVDDAVLLAGLARALVVATAAEELAGAPPEAVPEELLRGATWRAARSGLRGRLIDPVAGEAVRAPDLVHRLLTRIRPAAESTGDWEYLSDGVDALLRRGTSSERQRRALSTGEGEPGVVAALVAETRATP